MGQSASLYRIDKNDFPKIVDNHNDFGLFDITTGYEVFAKTFEGLQFVLSKIVDEANIELIQQLFYPKTFIGEQIDYAELDFETLPEDFDFEEQAVYYHEPAEVSKIWNLLSSITLETFAQEFDHNELNQQEIYPYGIWNDEIVEDVAFNVGHMSVEFQHLKSLFESADRNGEYVLCYDG